MPELAGWKACATTLRRHSCLRVPGTFQFPVKNSQCCMDEERWQKITTAKAISFGIGFALFLALVLASEPGFAFVLDHANLLFHEAGHPIIGVFSARLEAYGGTIGQLAFPVVLAVSFWRQGQAL